MTNPTYIAQNVIDQLQNLDELVGQLLDERNYLRHIIGTMKTENEDLKNRIKIYVSESEIYIKELQEIRTYYANRNSNN